MNIFRKIWRLLRPKPKIGISELYFDGESLYVRCWGNSGNIDQAEFHLIDRDTKDTIASFKPTHYRSDLAGKNVPKEGRLFVAKVVLASTGSLNIRLVCRRGWRFIGAINVACTAASFDTQACKEAREAPIVKPRLKKKVPLMTRLRSAIAIVNTDVRENFSFWFVKPIFDLAIQFKGATGGALWLNLGPLFLIATVTFIFSGASGSPFTEQFPYGAIGYLLWTQTGEFLSSSLNFHQRSRPFLENSGFGIEVMALYDVQTHLVRFFCRTPILILALLLLPEMPSVGNVALAFFGFIVITMLQGLVLLVLGALVVRLPDLRLFIDAVMRIGFLATPVFWKPERFGDHEVLFVLVHANPFAHAINVVRDPLLGQPYPIVSLAFIAVAMIVFAVLYAAFRKAIHFIMLYQV